MMRARSFGLIAAMLGAATELVGQSPLPRAAAERCTPAIGDASAAVMRAWTAAGLDRAAGRIIHTTSTDVTQQNFQSDRPYAPFFSMLTQGERWFDLTARTERAQAKMSGLGAGGAPTTTVLANEQASFFVRDTLVRPLPALFASSAASRAMSAWAVLADWRAASDAKVVSRCIYREYPRLVVERAGVYGPERLYLDVKTGLPVKLDREEPHYLWGQVRSEFVYQTWIAAGELIRPGAVVRLTDGDVQSERVDGEFSLIPADSAPPMRIPASPTMKTESAMFLQPLPVDTERVGSDLMVLRNRGYGHGVIMLRDTVFLLDATQSDARGRLDSVWIARLYPKHKAVVVVVTDLAWPHIAGVRYWVSRGATVVSHASSRPMLERVIARRWTRDPDALESVRRAKPVRFKFVGVSDSLSLAGGGLRLYPIDGIASEGALMAWSPSDRSLWASDYIQTVSEPTNYTTEVARAAARVGIQPLKVAAEHLGPTDWPTITRLAAKLP
jgi:hypothetical protein